jgi:hypothetical protein
MPYATGSPVRQGHHLSLDFKEPKNTHPEAALPFLLKVRR